MAIFSRFLPTLNFLIGSSALGFQMTVLYPWHEELDKEFKALEKTQKQELRKFHEMKLQKLDELDHKMSIIIAQLNAKGPVSSGASRSTTSLVSR